MGMPEDESYEVDFSDGRPIVKRITPVNAPATPVNQWGCIGEPHAQTFGSYPQDGECPCEAVKHHVHCGVCGGITQVG